MPAPTNPLLEDWSTNRGVPPFARIHQDHYMPAFEAALAAHRAEIDAIANQADAPTFENTIEAMELSGKHLSQVSSVFHNLNSADTTPEMQALQRTISPILAEHSNRTLLNETLFSRIDRLMSDRDDLGLDPEQDRVLERYHTMFVRAGAQLDDEQRQRIDDVMQRLATLGTQFSQNVLADENAYELVLETEDDLAGLPEFVRTAAARAAEDRDKPGKYVITLSRSSIAPFLQFSERRDLREQAFNAWTRRGENGGETDNRSLIAETVKLRSERARLLGFENFAAFKLDDQMAGTPDAVRALLDEVWEPALARAERECEKLQDCAQAEGGNFRIEPWDWRFYAEKVRKQEFDIGEEEIKPYLQLDKMIEAAFDTAHRLFGVTVTEIDDVATYHPDVRVFEVTDGAGKHVGLFFGDYFARPSKRSGAWISAFRRPRNLGDNIRPIIVNVMNFSRGADGEATLLTFDDARTLFHEFGHALHG
ncbi:MAG: M3 family metallopeptidase, partial [Proteobacteria bacterium]|nr:M3 family metallopeptidase [Pseudomonadota bacterium]